MKRRLLFLGLLLVSCLLASCCKPEDNELSWTERWIVASETVKDSEGLPYFWVKRNGKSTWEKAEAFVKGFEHQPGYEYEIVVKATVIPNPPADASARKYSLVRVISKEKKTSDVPELPKDLWPNAS